jgi:hypothetical protein
MGKYNENHKKKKIKEKLKKCIDSVDYFRQTYCHDMDPILWENAMPKIEGLKGKIIITSTPAGNNYFKELWDKSKKDSE